MICKPLLKHDGHHVQASDAEEAVTEPLPQRHAAAAELAASQPDPAAGLAAAAQLQGGSAEPPTTAAGGAVGVAHDDEAAVCGTLFHGLVFYFG